MSYEFQPLSGGIDYVQPNEPTPEANASWAEINGENKIKYDGTNSTGITKKWSFSVEGSSVNGLHLSNDVIYSASDKLKALNISDGSKIWEHINHRTTDYDYYPTCVTELDGIVYSGGTDNRVIASNVSDGSEIWKHEEHINAVRAITSLNGLVFSAGANNDNKVVAVNSSDGNLVWSHNLHNLNSNNNYATTLYSSDGVVYSAGTDNRVIAVNASDGSKIWSHNIHSDNISSVVEAGGVVYSGAEDNQVIAVNASDGGEIWSKSIHNNRVYSLHYSNNVLYSGGNYIDTTFKATKSSDGSGLWSEKPFESIVNNIAEYAGILYVGGNGQVTALTLDGLSNSDTAESFYPSDWQLKVSDGTSWWGV
jgi:outer membrane protein assembly factor BamB